MSRSRSSARRQLCGAEALSSALDAGAAVSLVLVREGESAADVVELVARAESLGIPVRFESERSMRRMAEADGQVPILALAGPPPAENLDALMLGEGIVFLLAGLRYPANVGFILRCVEVAGGAGVVLESDWGEAQRAEALRIGMHADRFFPVLDGKASEAVASARGAGRRIVAVETNGVSAPWEIDLETPCMIIVGSETTGVPDAVLDSADDVVRIPSAGFIPSYNVQAAVGILLGEWMRQSQIESPVSPSGQ